MRVLIILVVIFLILVGSLAIGFILTTALDLNRQKTPGRGERCRRCGGDIPDNARFCPHCGQNCGQMDNHA
ncbi:MAG: hypothetical protein KatS3mg104_2260 [Phycisphaerae bacterium]|nr:MAG: hypothetical protein KatS3mg104_2260 [Phycisphaerae bacterium]